MEYEPSCRPSATAHRDILEPVPCAGAGTCMMQLSARLGLLAYPLWKAAVAWWRKVTRSQIAGQKAR